MSEALLILVHGSPTPGANAAMFGVVARLADRAKSRGRFPIVEVGFMECNEPTIPDAIAHCVARGARRVVAVPYFLHTGTHVCQDLPGLMEEARTLYPTVDFFMGDYLGLSPALTNLLARRATEANSPS
jgi:sirohydrochlorin ferrochelatase